MQSLAGKTALVTGGSRGIGAAIVRRLAAAGAHVAVNYAAAKAAAEALVAEIRAAGGAAFTVHADIASLDDIAAMFATCDERFGAAPNLDILVNNAGYGSNGSKASLAEENEAHFDRQFAVNVKGPHFVCQQALRRLRDRGRVVNIGSVSGRVAQPQSAGYAMTKRALQSLTFSMAQQLARRQITVNLVAPGAVDTDFLANLRAKPGFDEAVARNTPMGRMGRPDDIAGAVMMLVGDDARWVTGQIIEASGGLQL
jgi:NAD(P)-dependent dehydrogenase (short-subunit alcohol dehydrogenase family)